MGDRETLVADSRYRFIEKAVKASVKKAEGSRTLSTSDRIDKILTHKIWALPIFIASMLVIFLITFGPFGTMLSDYVAYFMKISYPGVTTLRRDRYRAWLSGWYGRNTGRARGRRFDVCPRFRCFFLFFLLEDSATCQRHS